MRKNETALITTKGNEFKTNIAIIDDTAKQIDEMLRTASTAEKALASKFLIFRNALKDNSNVYQNTKFPDLINTLFGDRYSGNTAWQYAQCAELFEGTPDVWDFFNFGKLVAMKTLCTKKSTDDGMSVAEFFLFVGDTFDSKFLEEYNNWKEENAKILEKVERFTVEGDKETAEMYKAKCTVEPVKPITTADMDDSQILQKRMEYGRQYLYKTTDKVFKEWLSKYKASKHPETETTETAETAETETAETAETPIAEKTIAELKADAITALQNVMWKLGETPKTLTKAIEYLEK